MCKWHAKIENEAAAEWGHFVFHDLSDSELLTILELASRNNPKVTTKVWCEKEPNDVAHIGGMDYDPVAELDGIIEEVKNV